MEARTLGIKRLLPVLVIIAVLLFGAMLGVNASAAGTAESESNNTAQTANEIAVGEAVSANLSTGGDVDWFKFTVSEAGCFSISFKHDVLSTTNETWKFQLYQPDGVTYIDGINSYWAVAGNENRETEAIGIGAGTYYVKVYSGRHSEANYSLTVNFTEADNWESETNNTVDKADAIEPNKTYYGNTSSSGENDYYKLTLEKDGYVTLDFKHEVLSSTNVYWKIWIYHSDGVTYYDDNNVYISVKGNEDYASSELGMAAGTYYIKVTTGSHSAATYNFKLNFTESEHWEKEINNTSATANGIDFNTEYSGSLYSGSDHDWYKVDVEESGYMQVHFKHDVIATKNVTWRIRVFQSDGVTYYDDNNASIDVRGNEDTSTLKMGVAPGSYYIKIDPASHSSATYRMTAEFTAADNWESEINNSYGEAHTVEFDKEYKGTIYSVSDVDWYKFTLSADSDVMLALNHPLISDNGKSTFWHVRLYENDAVTEVMRTDFVGNETSMQTEAVALSAGTYYVRVTKASYLAGVEYGIVVTEKHDHTGAWETTVAPTCTEEGSRERVCTKCGRVETEAVEALGHSFDEGVEVRAASAVSGGEILHTCTVCGETEISETPSFWWVIPAVIAVAVIFGFGIVNYIRMIKRK